MMTDKEIIINGIDVSECAYLKPLDNGVYECIAGTQQCLKYRVCECNHNCYFKQLKRKEQECEELKFNEKNFRIDAARAKMKASKYKQALGEIEKLAKHNNFLVRDPFCGTGYRDLSGQILNIINKAKEK